MRTARLHNFPERPLTQPGARLPLARTLLEEGQVTPWQMFFALRCQKVWNASLVEILEARGWAAGVDLQDIQARHLDLRRIDLSRTPPMPSTSSLLPPDFCLKHNVVPWVRLGKTVILATGRPHHLDQLRMALPAHLKHAQFAVAKAQDIENHIALQHRQTLCTAAESTVPIEESCRTFATRNIRTYVAFLVMLGLAASFVTTWPGLALSLLLFWTILTLLAATGLRLAALYVFWHNRGGIPSQVRHLLPASGVPPPNTFAPPVHKQRLPRISVLVPLFRETEIAAALIHRLTQLTYPRALLDVILVLEEKDTLTRATIAQTRLPGWMRVVQVPEGSGITTKPRALNYALPFCRGEIIGIWDAEDAPAADQLERVAQQFANTPPKVACLQGILDYYNPHTNWLSRCFSIEYAAWFRLVLPALTHLGFAIPLGGTTVFLRRRIIEEVGGWDSHNVTEDADLGMRLARRGYRTELLSSVTHEEANCRPIAWIRQRSRWLKGYMATYIVHMRAPIKLWCDLGVRKFFGFQILFLCTLSQFLLAPLLWLIWPAALGMPVPLSAAIPAQILPVLSAVLLCAATTNLALWIVATQASGRPRLLPWILTMAFYFPLATMAAYKGLIEMLIAPFYWDKTSHGKTVEATRHGISPVLHRPR